MNPEKLPQTQNDDKYNFNDLLPAEQSPDQNVDAGLDQLDAKVTAAENHHKNEVERQERQAKLEGARRQLSEFSAAGANPAEILTTAKSLVVDIPIRNKYGIVAMADKPAAKAGETEPTGTAEEPKSGEAEPDSEPDTTPTPAPAKKSWFRHPVQRFRQEADKVIPSEDEITAREEAAAKAATETAERDKGLIDADENPTRFAKAAGPTRAERKQMKANTKAAQKEQAKREEAARLNGTSAASAARPYEELDESKKPKVVKVELSDPAEEAEEAKTPDTTEPDKATAAKQSKAAAKPTTPATSTGSTEPGSASKTTAELGADVRAARSAAIATYRAGVQAGRATAGSSEATATSGDGDSTAESAAVLSSTVPAPRAARSEAKPVVGSGDGGTVTLDDLGDLDKLLNTEAPEQVTVTVDDGEEEDPETVTTTPINVVTPDDGSELGALKGALSRGESNEEEGETTARTGRMRRMGRAIGAAATSFMDSRLMTGRWRDASAEAREERHDREDEARRTRRQRQLERDASENQTTPSAWLGTVEANADPGDPDGGGDDEETTSTATGADAAKKGAGDPDGGDGGNPDDPNNGSSEGEDPESRRPGFMKRHRRKLGLAAAGLVLTGLAGASAEFAPDSHAPRTSVSAEGHDHNKSTEDKKAADKGVETSESGSTGNGSDAELPPKDRNTATTPDTVQNETDTVEKRSDTDVVVTLKQGGTIYQSGIDAGLNATDVMNAVNNARITDATARGLQVGQQIDFHKSDNGEWTVKLQ